jgi:hypothetical protein
MRTYVKTSMSNYATKKRKCFCYKIILSTYFAQNEQKTPFILRGPKKENVGFTNCEYRHFFYLETLFLFPNFLDKQVAFFINDRKIDHVKH